MVNLWANLKDYLFQNFIKMHFLVSKCVTVDKRIHNLCINKSRDQNKTQDRKAEKHIKGNCSNSHTLYMISIAC